MGVIKQVSIKNRTYYFYNDIKRIVPNDVNTRITYTGHKLNTRFQMKDKTAQIHKHDLVYYVKCPDQSCNQDYLGETGRRI